jgi:hypothetical protein
VSFCIDYEILIRKLIYNKSLSKMYKKRKIENGIKKKKRKEATTS